MIPLSVLDLAPIRTGGDAAAAYAVMRDLALTAQRCGYRRYWIAEHHNLAGVGSTATCVLVGYLAAATTTLRVGAGGIMLPNHAPLIVAEQFGTLATLYPDRIDLGLGRAPGTDPVTAQALRRTRAGSDHDFPRDVMEVQAYFDTPAPDQHVRAVPGAGLHVPLYLLGSSLYSAQLAARLGLPYAFAAHFAPDGLADALHVYRDQFRPSAQLQAPYVMVAVNAVAAASDEEARHLYTSQQVQSLQQIRRQPGPLSPPCHDLDWSPAERAAVDHKLAVAFVGAAATLADGLAAFLERTQADELIVNSRIYDPQAAQRCLEILAEVAAGLDG